MDINNLDLKVLFTFIPKKWLRQSIHIFFTKIAHETSNAKFSYIEIWFIDQSSKPLET